MYSYKLNWFLVPFILTWISTAVAVTVPVSQGGGSRAYMVRSSDLHHATDFNISHESSDNSYDNALAAAGNGSSSVTALLDQIVKDEHGHMSNATMEYLAHVPDRGAAAEELETAAKYLLSQLEADRKSSDDGTADVTRVLDGFVFLNNLYESLVRPAGEVTKIKVDAIIHPWFSVNEQRNEMTVTVTLVQNWSDPRLAYESRLKDPAKFDFVTLTNYMHMVDMWLPDTFIVDEKRSTVVNDVLRIKPLGDVSREQRISVTVNCPFYKNDKFPFDSPKCSISLASFSFDHAHIQYDWANISLLMEKQDLHSNGFRVKTVEKMSKMNVTSLHSSIKHILVLEFKLERKLAPYVTKLCMPLACFCLISICGLMHGVGPEIGAGLSYFMFGLMSIFMAIGFKDITWGNGRTRLDTYYVLCVMTVVATGIVNMFRLKRRDSKSLGSSHESYELQEEHLPHAKNIRNGSSISTNAISQLWQESDNFTEEDNFCESAPNKNSFRRSCPKLVKDFCRRLSRILKSICSRINDFSVSIMLIVFISWNCYYWITSLSTQD